MSDYLPEEVILQILHKLPLKKIVQCTCVSKSWKSLIKNRSFVFNHLHNQTHLSSLQKDPLLLVRFVSDGKEHYSLYLDNQSVSLYKNLHLSGLKAKIPNIYFRFIASCNGLIFLADDLALFTYTYVLWNPFIRKYKVLPPPIITYETHGDFDAFVGFGFDSVASDFKVLRVVIVRKFENCEKPRPQVEVFSLNSGVWRVITANVPKYEIVGRGSHCFVRGSIHFIGYRDGKNVILCFDVANEVFHRVKLPDELVTELASYILVSGYKESSISLFHKDIFGGFEWHVWVMKEYGVATSWTKILNIPETVAGLPTPLGFRKTGDLMIERQNGEIISVDPQSQKTKDLGIRGKKPGYYSFVDGYMESLVLFDRAKK